MESTNQSDKNLSSYSKVEEDLEKGEFAIVNEGALKGVAGVSWRTRGKTIALGVALLLLLLLSINLIVPIIPSVYKNDRQVSVPVSCTNWVPTSSFAQFSPAGGDDKHPLLNKARNDRKTYMGTATFITKDYNASTAIRAMLGDESPYVESYLFTYLKYRLMDDKAKLHELIKRGGGHRTVKRTPQIVDEILNNFKYKDIVFPDEAQASCIAAKLIDMYEMERMSEKDFVERAFWYNYHEFIQDPVDFVWSTSYQIMATYYGKDVVVFKEDSRALDLNYFNYYKDGRIQSDFGDQTGIGEFVTPGFKQPSKVVGFHTYYESRFKSDMVPPFNHISYAFYKIVFEGKPYVLLVDGLMNNGSNSLCLDIVDDMPHFCDHQWTYTPAPSNPAILPEIPRITGIFSVCNPVATKKHQCQPIPQALIERYKNDHKTSMDVNKLIYSKLAHTLDFGEQKVLFTPLSGDKQPIIV